MTLDEAIDHAEKKSSKTKCGEEHAQLAVWLKELKELRETVTTLKNQLRTARQEVETIHLRQARQRQYENDSLPYADERR